MESDGFRIGGEPVAPYGQSLRAHFPHIECNGSKMSPALAEQILTMLELYGEVLITGVAKSPVSFSEIGRYFTQLGIHHDIRRVAESRCQEDVYPQADGCGTRATEVADPYEPHPDQAGVAGAVGKDEGD